MVTPSCCHDESGFTLIEVLVSALLVALVAVGTLAGIDGASQASGENRARAEASALAQQELERLKVLNPATLAGYVTTPRADSTDTRSNVAFTTSTVVNWRTDINQGQACAGASNGTRYLSLQVTTTYNQSGSHRVTATGQAAVPVTGNRLIVSVFKGDKSPQAGVTVELRDASNALLDTLTTSSAGCVEWDYLAPGSYTVDTSRAGYVSSDGSSVASQTVNVGSTGATTVGLDYDQAGSAQITRFWTFDGSTNITASAGNGMDQVTFANSMLPSPRTVGTAGSLVPSMTASNLLPYSAAYSVYAGTCPGEQGTAGTDEVYFSQVTAGGTASVYSTTNGLPNGPVSDANGMRLPGFKLTINLKTSFATDQLDGGHVVLTRRADAGCTSPITFVRTTKSDGTGRLPFPGLPFGTYDVCADWTNGTGTWNKTGSSLVLDNWNIPSSMTLTIDSTRSRPMGNGAC